MHYGLPGNGFHMDEEFVKKVVVKEAERLRQEQLKFEKKIYLAEELSTQLSNGKPKS